MIARVGWTRSTLNVGDKVALTVFPLKNGEAGGALVRIELPDGRVMGGSPMGFLNQICGRPTSEKPYLLRVAELPADQCQVPVQAGVKKPLSVIATWI